MCKSEEVFVMILTMKVYRAEVLFEGQPVGNLKSGMDIPHLLDLSDTDFAETSSSLVGEINWVTDRYEYALSIGASRLVSCMLFDDDFREELRKDSNYTRLVLSEFEVNPEKLVWFSEDSNRLVEMYDKVDVNSKRHGSLIIPEQDGINTHNFRYDTLPFIISDLINFPFSDLGVFSFIQPQKYDLGKLENDFRDIENELESKGFEDLNIYYSSQLIKLLHSDSVTNVMMDKFARYYSQILKMRWGIEFIPSPMSDEHFDYKFGKQIHRIVKRKIPDIEELYSLTMMGNELLVEKGYELHPEIKVK